uniref:Uncharacterized protein n=1 Tax=Oryza punctata TaxID=4537 RepID=A0A0E0M6F5_ORYPU
MPCHRLREPSETEWRLRIVAARHKLAPSLPTPLWRAEARRTSAWGRASNVHGGQRRHGGLKTAAGEGDGGQDGRERGGDSHWRGWPDPPTISGLLLARSGVLGGSGTDLAAVSPNRCWQRIGRWWAARWWQGSSAVATALTIEATVGLGGAVTLALAREAIGKLAGQ